MAKVGVICATYSKLQKTLKEWQYKENSSRRPGVVSQGLREALSMLFGIECEYSEEENFGM